MKVMIGAIVFSLLATAAIFVVSKLGRSPRRAPERAGIGATQDLVSFADFDGPLAVRKDGTRVAFIAVDGKSFEFLTPEQRDLAAADLEGALSATDRPFTIHRVTKPVDPSENLRRVEAHIDQTRSLAGEMSVKARSVRVEKGKKASFALSNKAKALEARKRLLEEVYKPRAQAYSQTYRIASYVTMAFPDSKMVQLEAQKAIDAFEMRLAEAGYETRLMRPGEIIEALANYYGRFPSEAEAREAGF